MHLLNESDFGLWNIKDRKTDSTFGASDYKIYISNGDRIKKNNIYKHLLSVFGASLNTLCFVLFD